MIRLRSALLLTCFGLVGAGCASTATGGDLHRNGEQQILVLRGTPYEMGHQHGSLLGPKVRLVVRETLAWTHTAGLSRAELAEIYGQLEPHIPERYQEEMRGLAAGSGAPLRDIQLLHAMPTKFHCSGAAVANSMTRDGKLYHARSLDYSLDIGVADRLQNHALLIVREPSDGIPNAVPAWAGFLGAVTGLNERGISVGEKGSASRDESYAGMPMIFTVREVLRRSSNLDQAVDLFRRGPRTCGFNFIVGSGDERQAVALEVTRNHFFVSGFGDIAEDVPPHTAIRDAVRRTNHFIGKETAATQRRPGQGYDPRSYMQGSWERYRWISEYLKFHAGRLDAPTMVALLRKYSPEHPCLHQAVMCSSDRVIWVAQAKDDRTTKTPGAQNQKFYGYDLRTRQPCGVLEPPQRQ